jgi:tetratricopeptide (TPR) repeat protein
VFALDPHNPVVQLCSQGMQAEFQGRHADACRLFHQAWELHTDDLEACIAAHYVARHQDDPHETLRWNALALESAERAGSDPAAFLSIESFFPSLYLNMGWSYEQLGQMEKAGEWYRRAGAVVDSLPANGYRDTVADGIRNGLARLQAAERQQAKQKPAAESDRTLSS